MVSPPPPATDGSTAPEHAGTREWLALGVLVLVVTLLAVDGTVLYLAVPSLTQDLAPSATQLLWIGDVYALVLSGLLITMGNVADRIGRKRLLLMGTLAFGSASALAAFAPNAETLIAARALLGVAGATLMPSTLSIVRAMFVNPAQRAKAIAVWSAGAMGGAALGPLVGGALLENFWWGSVFLINIPVMVVTLIAGYLLIPESFGDRTARIDLASSLMSIATVIPLVYAIKHFITDGLDVITVSALAIGLVVGWLFVRRQTRLETPLLDVSLFKIPAFSGAIGANVLALFGFLGLLFFFSQYLQMVRGYGPLKAGVAELPATFASMAVIIVLGWLLKHLGAGRSIGAGLFLAAAGLTVMSMTTDLDSYWGLGAGLAIVGLGTGVAMTLSVDAVVGAVPVARAGAASAVSETAYELGGALGIAILGSIHTRIYRSNLELPADASPEEIAAAQESLAIASYSVDSPGVLVAAQDAFTSAMENTALIAAAILVAAGAVAWKMIPSPLGAEKPSHDH